VTDALVGLLADRDRCREMGEAAARFVADGFTWPRRTGQLRDLLAEVVG
jgi:glycosyltransferase involved in cell wall biosynthesis